jgi:UPF0716 family protein affecting phage T7 exclusion
MKIGWSQWVGIMCLLLAVYILLQVGQGLMAGEVLKLSKYGREVILRSAQPERFWLAIGFWSIGAGLLLVTGFKKVTRSR